MSLDIDLMRYLQDLPDDLTFQGWTWQHAESSTQRMLASTYHVAVYTRPFEQGIDDDALAHHTKGTWVVRISTQPDRCESWEAARAIAITRMREADARRQPAGGEPE